MTDFGRRAGIGDMLRAVYDPNLDGLVESLALHAADHQSGGDDEINAAGLIGRTDIVDRGDHAAHDFSIGDFTFDGDWHDLDLSSLLPAGTKFVMLSVSLQDDTPESWAMFRENGNVNTYNSFGVLTQVANIEVSARFMLAINTNQVIEYRFLTTEFTSVYLNVIGWLV